MPRIKVFFFKFQYTITKPLLQISPHSTWNLHNKILLHKSTLNCPL